MYLEKSVKYYTIMQKIKNLNFLLSLFIVIATLLNSNAQRAYIPPIVGSNNVTYVTTSSYLPPSYGLTYAPKNINDNSLFTWWSPIASDRETCWIKVNFDSERSIDNIKIHGGAHYPNFSNLGNLYYLNLRLKSAYLTFSNGTTAVIDLEDIDQIQTIYFQKIYTSYVIIRPMRYYPSYKWNDPCISYIKFGN
jgi:hypothetical protein